MRSCDELARLDLIFTLNEPHIRKVKLKPSMQMSDHSVPTFEYLVEVGITYSIKEPKSKKLACQWV